MKNRELDEFLTTCILCIAKLNHDNIDQLIYQLKMKLTWWRISYFRNLKLMLKKTKNIVMKVQSYLTLKNRLNQFFANIRRVTKWMAVKECLLLFPFEMLSFITDNSHSLFSEIWKLQKLQKFVVINEKTKMLIDILHPFEIILKTANAKWEIQPKLKNWY